MRRGLKCAFLFAVAALACRCAPRPAPPAATEGRGIPGAAWPLLGDFKLTYYWVAEEGRHEGPADVAVPGLPGKYSVGFVRELTTEGTGRLAAGRTVNAAGGGKYAFTESRWGLGCRGQPLVPFRSVATDPEVIPTGSVVIMKGFVGWKLPDGSVHDGIFWADDVGGSIKGMHVDVFVGRRKWMPRETDRATWRKTAFKMMGAAGHGTWARVWLALGMKAPAADARQRTSPPAWEPAFSFGGRSRYR